MSNSRAPSVTMRFGLSTIALSHELINAHASLDRYRLHNNATLAHLMNDPHVKNLLMKFSPQVLPLVNKAAYDKYILDLTVAATIDRKLIDLLQQEANEIVQRYEEDKKILLKRLEELHLKEAQLRKIQDEEFLRERELLIASLTRTIANLDQDLSTVLADCFRQINFLSNKFENIEKEKETVYEELGKELLMLLEKEEYKINGKPLFELEVTFSPLEHKRLQGIIGEAFVKEINPLYHNIKEIDEQIKAVSNELAKTQEDLENEKKKLTAIDDMTELEAKAIYDKRYENIIEGTEDDLLAELEEDERMMTQAEAQFDVEKKQEQLQSERETVKNDIDSVVRKREKITQMRVLLQERRDKLEAKLEAFEQETQRKYGTHKKVSPWSYKAFIANRQRKNIQTLDKKVNKLKTEESRLMSLKENLFNKFNTTIAKLNSLVQDTHEAIQKKAEIVWQALDKEPQPIQQATLKIASYEKAQQDCKTQIKTCQEVALEAKNNADITRRALMEEKGKLTGEPLSMNMHVEQLFKDIQGHKQVEKAKNNSHI